MRSRKKFRPTPRPRGVLSLWTKTPMFRPERGPLLVQTLAICLARRTFAETEFVTDRRGAELAAALGWQFDAVTQALEHYPADGLEHLWALGKLIALLLQDDPCIQYDGDFLFLKETLALRLRRARLVAQSPDFPRYYTGHDMHRGLERLGFAPGLEAYNAGIIGGADVALVHDYAAEALALAQRFRGFDLNGTTASMLVEQYHLGEFARRRGVKVETLWPMMPTRAQVRRSGCAHLWGANKRRPDYIARAELRLARDFPDAHAAFCAGWQTLTEYTQPDETVWCAAL